MSKLDDIINDFATEVLRITGEEIDRLKLERDEFKTKYENLTSFESIYAEYESLKKHDASSVSNWQFALKERDQARAVITVALEIMKNAEKRSKAGVPFEDELNEVLDLLLGGTYFEGKE